MPLSVTNITKLRSGTVSSISGAIPDPAANDLMVTVIGGYLGNGANHQASDSENVGNYSTVISRDVSSGSTNNTISLHYLQNSVAGTASSGNASAGVGANAITAVFYQIAGASTASAFVTGEAAGSTGNSSSPNPGAVTNSTANAIFVAGFANNDGGVGALIGENAVGSNGTWSTNSSAKETGGNQFQVMGSVYQIVTSTSARTHVWQSTGGAGANWAAVNAAFQAAAAAAGRNTNYMRALLGVGR